jgi:hypothetical protein
MRDDVAVTPVPHGERWDVKMFSGDLAVERIKRNKRHIVVITRGFEV